MNFQNIKTTKIGFALLLLIALAFSAFGQDKKKKNEPSTFRFKVEAVKEMAVAVRTNLYCAGYIQASSFDTSREVVGSDDEKDQNFYAQGDNLYISAGSSSGMKVGDMFSVIRPRGKFKSKFSRKKNLGVYVQEVGGVEVVEVRRDVSIVRVKTSCGVILLGDLLKRVQKRTSPMFKQRPALNIFKSSSSGVSGRIVLAKDGIELIGREHIVYVDLGSEDNVKVGDYMTIYRPLGTGNIFQKSLSEFASNKEAGYESDRYRGGRYSNQAPRKKGSNATGAVVTSENAKSRRPKGLRRVLGELVVLNVLERTATAIVVRTTSEIHTGDHVEVQ